MAPKASYSFPWKPALAVLVLALAARYHFSGTGGSSHNNATPITPPPSATTKRHCYTDIATLDPEQPAARCFDVRDGLFASVSTSSSTTGTANTTDGYVIPGLWDGHGHLLQYGEFLHAVDLFGVESIDEARSRIKAYRLANPGSGAADEWIRGVGWDQTEFGRMPTAADIEDDPELQGVYMMLDRIDVHCTWVSQAVLDLLLPADLPDEVPGGEIVRDPGMGVFCDNAMEIVLDRWPQPSPEYKARTVRSAMVELHSLGIVGMHDAGATPGTLRLYDQMAASPAWTLRVYSMFECDKRNEFCPHDVPQMTADEDFLSVRSVKLFADGALGSWGSAMIEPYADRPETSGSLLIERPGLIEAAKSWAAAGFQVNIHAIGDLANRNTVDALEAALQHVCPAIDTAVCQSQQRFRIEHAQIIHPDDQERILAIGIIPSVQPTHATSDMKYAESRLGPSRLRREAYRMRSMLSANVLLGSDFPVEPPAPFQGIYAAITRRNPHTGMGPGAEDPSSGFLPDETLTLDEALRGFTTAPAYGAFLEDKAGVIKSGAYADWVVLDAPLTPGMDVEALRTLSVRETWVAGRMVYSRDQTQGSG